MEGLWIWADNWGGYTVEGFERGEEASPKV